jgi:hypothetical protein
MASSNYWQRVHSFHSVLAAVFVLTLAPACASPLMRLPSHHLLRGSIVHVSGKIAYVSVGNRDRAKTGHRLKVYRLGRSPTFHDGYIHTKHYVGIVSIRRILDDDFAAADILSGSVRRYDIAEMKIPKVSLTGFASDSGKIYDSSGGAL